MGSRLLLREYVFPTFMVGAFPFLSLCIVAYPRCDSVWRITEPFGWNLLQNNFAWAVVASWSLWCYVTLKTSNKRFKGPVTSYGEVPVYVDNGLSFYVTTVAAILAVNALNPAISVAIYDNMLSVIACLNVVALVLCTVLCIQGLRNPSEPKMKRGPLVMEYYRGVNLHPRYFGIDVKQYTNSRFGVGGWQALVLTFYLASLHKDGFNPGLTVNVVLQSIYLAKFFYWETGYFNTLDITLDRAGFYLCWGCLVYIPSMYAFTTYFFVNHLPSASNAYCAAVFLFGVTCILLNYSVDYQKELFRGTNGQCVIWGKKPTFIQAEYRDAMGVIRKNKLLTSGFWGVSRHINYVFELGLALCWALVGVEYGLAPFTYFIFLVFLLIHRIYRDEEKCSNKYKKHWTKYCSQVKYRLIPFVY